MSKILQNCLALMPAQSLAMMPADPNAMHLDPSPCEARTRKDIVVVPMQDIKKFVIHRCDAGEETSVECKVNLYELCKVNLYEYKLPFRYNPEPYFLAGKHVVRITGAGDPSNFAEWTNAKVESIVKVVLDEVERLREFDGKDVVFMWDGDEYNSSVVEHPWLQVLKALAQKYTGYHLQRGDKDFNTQRIFGDKSDENKDHCIGWNRALGKKLKHLHVIQLPKDLAPVDAGVEWATHMINIGSLRNN